MATSKRTELPFQMNIGLPDVVVAAEVDEKADDDEGVAEHGGEQGRADHGMVLLAVEDVGEGAGGEPACGQGNARGDVDADPDAPGGLVVEVRNRADAEKKSCRGKGEPYAHEGEQHHHPGRQELFFDRRVVILHPSAPLESISSRLSGLRRALFRYPEPHMMPPRTT